MKIIKKFDYNKKKFRLKTYKINNLKNNVNNYIFFLLSLRLINVKREFDKS